MKKPPFLSTEEVLYIHEEQLNEYDGQAGVRDLGLLESALSQPLSSFGGEYLHSFPFGMAAAYAYHIAENQPFVDGNKRTALVSAVVFLDACDVKMNPAPLELYHVMIDIANKKLSKKGLEELFKRLSEKH